MASKWTSLALSIVILGAPVAGRATSPAPAAPATPAAEPQIDDRDLAGQDLAHPPPGSPEDQALWRAGYEVTQAVQLERARASRLQLVLMNLRYNERLQGLRSRDDEGARQAATLQRGLSDAHAVQFSIQNARWPVDTYRVCGYPSMEFGSMLIFGKSTEEQLAKHRAMLTGCVEQAQLSIARMKEGNDGLEAAMRAIDAAVPPTALAIQAAAPAPGKETAGAVAKAAAVRPVEAHEERENHEKHEKHDHPGKHHADGKHADGDRDGDR